MFKGLGAMMSLLGNGSKIQEEMQKFQEQVSQITAEASSEGGLVRVRANGRLEIQSIQISADALADREKLETLTASTVNEVLAKIREQLAHHSAEMAKSMGLPPGMLGGGFPGMS